MKDQLSKFVSKYIGMAIILFALRCAISWKDLTANASLYNLYGFAGEAIGVAAILMAAYERFLWKFMPFDAEGPEGLSDRLASGHPSGHWDPSEGTIYVLCGKNGFKRASVMTLNSRDLVLGEN